MAGTLACLLLVETICCIDQRWGITICILVVSRSDFRSTAALILDDFSVACVQVSAQCARVCVCAAPAVIYACCHLACTTSKGQECHLVPRGYLLKVIGYVTSGTRSQRILAGDNRSATPPEQLRPLSSVKKLIKLKFMSLQTLTTQFPLRVKMSTLVKQIIKRLCCVFFFFNKINAVLNFYTIGERLTHHIGKKESKRKTELVP